MDKKFADLANYKLASTATESISVGTSNLLIIDDSNQICSMMISGIVKGCAEIGRACQIIQSGPFGLIETVPMNFSTDMFNHNPLTVYTANSPVNALPVLQLPGIKHLTIICDIIMPTDSKVGLLGLLRELTALRLPVNLVFASGEGQNRYYVEELIKNGKAYFLEKGTDPWIYLPYALVQKSNMFQYYTIVQSDYDKGRLPQDPHAEQVTVYSTTNSKLVPTQPKLKSSSGLLALLMFWRKRSSSLRR